MANLKKIKLKDDDLQELKDWCSLIDNLKPHKSLSRGAYHPGTGNDPTSLPSALKQVGKALIKINVNPNEIEDLDRQKN